MNSEWYAAWQIALQVVCLHTSYPLLPDLSHCLTRGQAQGNPFFNTVCHNTTLFDNLIFHTVSVPFIVQRKEKCNLNFIIYIFSIDDGCFDIEITV